jgi:hypothetical protein
MPQDERSTFEKREVEAWLEHPVTRRVIKEIQDQLEGAMNDCVIQGLADNTHRVRMAVGAYGAFEEVLSFVHPDSTDGLISQEEDTN